MPSIYSINRKDCTAEDFLYVTAVDNEPNLFFAVVLHKGKMMRPFLSRVSFDDAKRKGDEWIAANLDGATTSYRYEM